MCVIAMSLPALCADNSPEPNCQCINRIHRIGQTAPVVRVRKFIVKDSVEEQIMKMQRCKRGIADELYSDASEEDVSGTRLSLNDFKLIFRGGK